MAANYWHSTQWYVMQALLMQQYMASRPLDIGSYARHGLPIRRLPRAGGRVDLVHSLCVAAFVLIAVIAMLSKRLNLRQRVVSTASVYFQRFYSKNTYAGTDPFLVLTTCVYLAAKVEEATVRIKTLCAEASKMFSEMGYKELPNSVPMVAEMEFFLMEELEFDLIVFHPYHILETLCDACSAVIEVMQPAADPVQIPRVPSPSTPVPGLALVDEKPDLERENQLLQMAWFVANDLYCMDLPLRYPPYVLAVACVYVALVLFPAGAACIHASLERKDVQIPEGDNARKNILAFLAGLNVSLPLIASVTQEILAFYELWHQLQQPCAEGGPSMLRDYAGMFRRLQRMHTAYRSTLLPYTDPRPAA